MQYSETDERWWPTAVSCGRRTGTERSALVFVFETQMSDKADLSPICVLAVRISRTAPGGPGFAGVA